MMHMMRNDRKDKDGYCPLPNNDDTRINAHPMASDVSSTRGPDIVQFMVPVLVVDAEIGHAEVPIMRIGPCANICKFTWRTVAGSALPGKQYVESNGQIEMAIDESESSIAVPILCDPFWNATKEFRIVLENSEGCELGLYLSEMRIKVMDANFFPSDVFKQQITQELASKDGLKLQSINMFVLFREFLKLMRHKPGILWRTAVTIVFGLLRNIYDYMVLILSIYMVDTVFNENKESGLIVPGSRLGTAYCVALLTFIPQCIFFCLHRAEVVMDISGLLRRELSKSLFRKFMNYSARSAGQCSLPDMVSALIDDVGEVSFGYKRTLEIVRLFGQIATAVYFTVSKNPGVWWVVVVVPTLMFAWGKCRLRRFIEASENAENMQGRLEAFVNEILSKIRLISAYKQRPQINDLFADIAADLENTERPKKVNMLMNMLIPHMIGPILVAVYTILDAGQVLDKSVGLGTYLATIRVFGSLCQDFASLYEEAMSIVETFPALKNLTVLLNMPTELPDVMKTCQQQAKLTKQQRSKMAAAETPRADRLDIQLIGVTFSHPGSEPLFRGIDYQTEQGKIIGVDADSGKGRKTLLELLAGTIHPTSGQLFVPSHLRTLLVSREVLLLNLPLWANLTFGNKQKADPHRVENILKHFGMNGILEDPRFKQELGWRKKGLDDDETEAANEDVDHVNRLESLRESTQALIHLCRGFIMNPEVMLVHRPFVHFHDEIIMGRVREAIVDHRTNRGLLMQRETRMRRRPRTIFITPDFSRHEKNWLDEIWHLPDDRTKAHSGKENHCMQYKPGSDVDRRLKQLRDDHHSSGELPKFDDFHSQEAPIPIRPITPPSNIPHQDWKPSLALGPEVPPTPGTSLVQILESQLSQGTAEQWEWPMNAASANASSASMRYAWHSF